MSVLEKTEKIEKEEIEENVIISGTLSKEGSNWKTWKVRYFILNKDGELVYKKTKDEKEIINKLPVKGCCFSETKDKGKPFCLKLIKKNGIPFFISMSTKIEFELWKEKLIFIGAKFEEEKKEPIKRIKRPPRPKTRLETVNVKNWTTEDVCEWISAVTLRFQRPDLTKEYVECITERKISGYQLLQLTSEDLKKLNIKSLGQREHIREELDKLENQGIFDSRQQSIYLKFKNLDFSNNKHIKMGNWVESLCDVQLIKKTYLSQNLDSLPLEDLLDNDEMNEYKNSLKNQQVKIRVKLVITEICHTSVDKTLRLILSPLISKIPAISGEFGLFHTALIVGPYYLEWVDSSLCIPKRMVSSMALLSADIDEIAIPKENLDEVIDKIAEVVTDWNLNFTYRKSSGQTQDYEGNCQDFVDDLLNALGINPNFKGSLGEFLINMREKGKCNISFTPPDKSFREKFNLKKNSYEFNTHQELDEFVDSLMQKEPLFKSKYPSEYALLKSFDRAFWLRLFKSPEDKKLTPLRKEDNNKIYDKCPFGNPKETKSMF